MFGGFLVLHDTGRLVSEGAHQKQQLDRDRKQYTGAATSFLDTSKGSHTFKFGGEIYNETQWSGRAQNVGGNIEHISRARIEIEAMRLMVLKAAKAMDVLGNRDARVWVSMVKAMVPEKVCTIIDQAMQIHGATGISQWSPLSEMYVNQRHLRFADGPDEVHHMVVGRAELSRH